MLLLTPTLIILITSTTSHNPPRVHYQWNYINYTWPSSAAYEQAVCKGAYVKEHNVISGIKVWKDRVYLTVPRLKPGVPATLASVPLDPASSSPLLEPYPNWEMQREDDCQAFQLVQSMEIDPLGRMWVINNGRSELRSKEPRSLCPSRLVVFDLENNGRVLLNHVFPDDVAVPTSTYINDIVLDHEDGGWAYITENDSKHPGIIVFSLALGRSWKISHPSMLPQPEAVNMTVSGTSFVNRSPVNGIALSQASAWSRLVYYFPISSFVMFAVPTWVLKSGLKDVDKYVVRVGRKPSQVM